MDNLLHVGIDVDDKAFHAAAFNQRTGELMEYMTPPRIAKKKFQFRQKKTATRKRQKLYAASGDLEDYQLYLYLQS